MTVSLPAPLGPTTRTTSPGPIGAVVVSGSEDAPAITIDLADDR